jgi:hypothetical protein
LTATNVKVNEFPIVPPVTAVKLSWFDLSVDPVVRDAYPISEYSLPTYPAGN